MALTASLVIVRSSPDAVASLLMTSGVSISEIEASMLLVMKRPLRLLELHDLEFTRNPCPAKSGLNGHTRVSCRDIGTTALFSAQKP